MADAEKFVAAQNIMGTSQRDMLRFFVEAQGVFRETGARTVGEQLAAAKMAAPVMARIALASRTLEERGGHGMSEAKQMDMLRFVEQAGGLKSPQRFNALLDAGFKAVQSSGGNVDFTQYRQFMARGGVAAMSLSNRSLFADLEPLIGEMKGSTAGTALMTAFNRLSGIVRIPNQVAHELVKNGLWDGSKIVWNSQGGIKQFTGNPLRDQALLGSDPIEFYRRMVQPMYARMGLDPGQRNRENALIFGRTGGALFSLVERQLPTILRSREALMRSRGIDQTVNGARNSAQARLADLEAKEANLKLLIGRQILPIYVRGLEILSGALSRVVAFGNRYPVLTKLAVAGLAAVSAMAVLGGSLILMTAGFRAIGLVLTVARLPMVVGFLATALAGLSLPIVGVVAALAGLGAALYALYNHWGAIKHFFGFGSDSASPVPGGVVRPASGFQHKGGDVYLDGKKVGRVMAPHMLSAAAASGNAPNGGTTLFDGRHGPLRPSMVGVGR
jgi:hypothetical protein